jgi:hypothetical protein
LNRNILGWRWRSNDHWRRGWLRFDWCGRWRGRRRWVVAGDYYFPLVPHGRRHWRRLFTDRNSGNAVRRARWRSGRRGDFGHRGWNKGWSDGFRGNRGRHYQFRRILAANTHRPDGKIHDSRGQYGSRRKSRRKFPIHVHAEPSALTSLNATGIIYVSGPEPLK